MAVAEVAKKSADRLNSGNGSRFVVSPTYVEPDADSNNNNHDNRVDTDNDSVGEPASRKISTETFVGKVSVDKMSIDTMSSASTIDYRSHVVTTAEIHRPIHVDDLVPTFTQLHSAENFSE
jgi:hypothetical protein